MNPVTNVKAIQVPEAKTASTVSSALCRNIEPAQAAEVKGSPAPANVKIVSKEELTKRMRRNDYLLTILDKLINWNFADENFSRA